MRRHAVFGYIFYAHDWIEGNYVPGRSYVPFNFLSSLLMGVKVFPSALPEP